MSDQGILPEARAVNVAELVDYAPGAIVSRTLAENDAGTLTLFAFDAGQALSEHSAPFDAIVQVLDGEAELIIDGKSVTTACSICSITCRRIFSIAAESGCAAAVSSATALRWCQTSAM